MELLSIKSDIAFKFVFGREKKECKKALIKLLDAILNIDIKEVTYMNPINVKNYQDDKETEFDIKATLDDGSIIDVEIQVEPHANFKRRLVYYGSELMGHSMQSGDSYSKLKKCIVISILNFNLIDEKETEEFHNTFVFKEKDRNFMLTDILSIVTLEMTKLKEKPIRQMTDVERWLNYIKYVGNPEYKALTDEIVEESEGIRMANELLKEVSSDQEMREAILSREHYRKKMATMLEDALAEGEKRGLVEGEKRGLVEGEKRGLIEGEKRGLVEGEKRGYYARGRFG